MREYRNNRQKKKNLTTSRFFSSLLIFYPGLLFSLRNVFITSWTDSSPTGYIVFTGDEKKKLHGDVITKSEFPSGDISFFFLFSFFVTLLLFFVCTFIHFACESNAKLRSRRGIQVKR